MLQNQANRGYLHLALQEESMQGCDIDLQYSRAVTAQAEQAAPLPTSLCSCLHFHSCSRDGWAATSALKRERDEATFILPKMMVVFIPSRTGPDTVRCVTFRRSHRRRMPLSWEGGKGGSKPFRISFLKRLIVTWDRQISYKNLKSSASPKQTMKVSQFNSARSPSAGRPLSVQQKTRIVPPNIAEQQV